MVATTATATVAVIATRPAPVVIVPPPSHPASSPPDCDAPSVVRRTLQGEGTSPSLVTHSADSIDSFVGAKGRGQWCTEYSTSEVTRKDRVITPQDPQTTRIQYGRSSSGAPPSPHTTTTIVSLEEARFRP